MRTETGNKTDRIALGRWLRLAALAMAVALVGVVVLGVMSDRAARARAAMEQTRALALHAAASVESELQEVHALFTDMRTAIEGSVTATTPHDWDLRQGLETIKAHHPYLMDLLILDDEARIVHWTGPGTPPFVRDRDYADAHFRDPRPHLFIGDPKMSRVHEGQWFFGMSDTIRDQGGSLRWILVAIIHVSAMADALERVDIPDGTQILLASTRGAVYAVLPSNESLVGQPLAAAAAFWETGLARQDTREPMPGGENPALITRVRVPEAPLTVTVGMDEARVLAPWRDRTRLVSALAAGGLLLVLLGVARAGITRDHRKRPNE